MVKRAFYTLNVGQLQTLWELITIYWLTDNFIWSICKNKMLSNRTFVTVTHALEGTSSVRWTSQLNATDVFAVMVLKEKPATKVWFIRLTLLFCMSVACVSTLFDSQSGLVRSLYLNVVNVPGFRVVILDYSPFLIYYIAPVLGRVFTVVQNWMTIAESSDMELSVHRMQVPSWIPP